jgi:hypothetical protein
VSLHAWRARDRRIAALRGRARLTDADHAELRRLEASIDRQWHRLPRSIEQARNRLAHLTAYADEIGLGPI